MNARLRVCPVLALVVSAAISPVHASAAEPSASQPSAASVHDNPFHYTVEKLDTGLNSLSWISASADGRRAIVSGIIDPAGRRCVKVFDLTSHKQLCQFMPAAKDIICVAMAPNGNSAAYVDTGRKQIVVINPGTGAEICSLQKDRRDWEDKDLGPVRELQFSSDGRGLWDASGQLAHAWDPAAGGRARRTLRVLPFQDDHVLGATTLPFGNGHRMASAISGGSAQAGANWMPSGLYGDGPVSCRVLVWNPAQGERQEVRQLNCKNPVETVSVSPNEQLLAVGQLSRYVAVWRVNDWKLLFEIRQAATLVRFVNNDLLAYKCADSLNTLALYGLRNHREIGQLVGHTGNIKGLVVTSDRHTLISCAEDGTIRIWKLDLKSGGG
ncbi:MAG: WD40 repeat domain-containing protein [Planctomycetes bacterium]|nr:WD40 repeat domain-containing protein [Planctomycetota bacterium]